MRIFFSKAMSLGQNCRPRFQLERVFGPGICSPGVFDWQGTPAEALEQYFSRDFEGLMELEDLYLDVGGIVSNRRFNTRHGHQFPKDATPEVIASLYPRIRQRHDRLCAEVKATLSAEQPVLLVRAAPVADPPDLVRRLLRKHFARLRYHLLVRPMNDIGPPTFPEAEWKGNFSEWDKVLARYTTRPLAERAVEAVKTATPLMAKRALRRLIRP